MLRSWFLQHKPATAFCPWEVTGGKGVQNQGALKLHLSNTRAAWPWCSLLSLWQCKAKQKANSCFLVSAPKLWRKDKSELWEALSLPRWARAVPKAVPAKAASGWSRTRALAELLPAGPGCSHSTWITGRSYLSWSPQQELLLLQVCAKPAGLGITWESWTHACRRAVRWNCPQWQMCSASTNIYSCIWTIERDSWLSCGISGVSQELMEQRARCVLCLCSSASPLAWRSFLCVYCLPCPSHTGFAAAVV